jgi:HPt (histidine-containing phosphotransfer) domain-containing protein
MSVRRSASWTALRSSYRTSLPLKLDEIQRLTVELAAQPTDGPRLERLSDAVHRLAGSAGSLGFDALGEMAGSCEMKLKTLRGRVDMDSLRAIGFCDVLTQMQRAADGLQGES